MGKYFSDIKALERPLSIFGIFGVFLVSYTNFGWVGQIFFGCLFSWKK
jgi:hypothetical protein